MPGIPRRTANRRAHFSARSRGGPAVVAFGGGHGLSANLSALTHLTRRITAVVTVADNGGSSGRLRAEMPILPPGDLRMALAALCEDSEWGSTWRDVVQHRFSSDGPMEGHALGNLMIAALWQLLDDPVAALDYMGELLGARGRVLPMALEPLDIEAEVTNSAGETRIVQGQAQVAATQDRVCTVHLSPSDPLISPEVLHAIDEADWLIIGPGSWYTSVLPHLMISELREAIVASEAKVCLTMNLDAGASETAGLRSVDLLEAVYHVAPDLEIHAIVTDPTSPDSGSDALIDLAHTREIDVISRQVARMRGGSVHDPVRLAAAYRDVFDGVITHPWRVE